MTDSEAVSGGERGGRGGCRRTANACRRGGGAGARREPRRGARSTPDDLVLDSGGELVLMRPWWRSRRREDVPVSIAP